MIKILLLALSLAHSANLVADEAANPNACVKEKGNGTIYHEKKAAAKKFLLDNKYERNTKVAESKAQFLLGTISCEDVDGHLEAFKTAVDFLLDNDYVSNQSIALQKSHWLLTQIHHSETDDYLEQFKKIVDFLEEEDYTRNQNQALLYANLWLSKTHYSETDDNIEKLRRLTAFAADKKFGLRKKTQSQARQYAMENALSFCADYDLEDEFASHFNAFEKERNSNAGNSIKKAMKLVAPHAFSCGPVEDNEED